MNNPLNVLVPLAMVLDVVLACRVAEAFPWAAAALIGIAIFMFCKAAPALQTPLPRETWSGRSAKVMVAIGIAGMVVALLGYS